MNARQRLLFACGSVSVVSTLLLVLSSCSGGAGTEKDEEAAEGKTPEPQHAIIIARGQDFAPYHYVEDGKLQGFAIEVIQRVASRVNREAVFRQYPWARCLLNAEKGEVHAMMNVFRTEEREKFMYYLDGNIIQAEENTLWILKEREDIIFNGNLAEMKEHRLGAIQGYSYGPVFDAAAESLDVELSIKEEDLVRKLFKKRVDLIVGNTLVIGTLLTKEGLRSKAVCLEPQLSSNPLFIAFSKASSGNDGLADAFGEALVRFKETDEYLEILNQYDVDPPE